jgi:hypothetical protein
MGKIRRGKANALIKLKQKMEGGVVGVVYGANILHSSKQVAVLCFQKKLKKHWWWKYTNIFMSILSVTEFRLFRDDA